MKTTLLATLFLVATCAAEDSLPPLKDGKAPTNLAELWGNYDPSKEPLDTQVVRCLLYTSDAADE